MFIDGRFKNNLYCSRNKTFGLGRSDDLSMTFFDAESIIFERSRFNLAFHPHTIYMAAFGLYYPIMLEYLGQSSPPSRLLIVPTRNCRRLTSRSTLHWASAKLLSLVIHFGDFDNKLVLSFWHFCYIFGYFQNTYGQVTLIHLFTAQWWSLTQHTSVYAWKNYMNFKFEEKTIFLSLKFKLKVCSKFYSWI